MESQDLRVPVVASVGGGLWFPALSAVMLAAGVAMMAFAPGEKEFRYTAWFLIALGGLGVALGLHTHRQLAGLKKAFVLRAEDVTLFDRHGLREVVVPYKAFTEVKLYAVMDGEGYGPPNFLFRWTVGGKSDQLIVDEALVGEQGFDALIDGLEARAVTVNDQYSAVAR